MKVLVMAAHPDDELLGCGGTMAKLIEEGHEVHILVFADGSGARDNEYEGYTRIPELMTLANFMGVKSCKAGNFPDNKMDSVPLLNVCKFIEKNVNFEPDIIFTHHPSCLNIDHATVTRATLTAFRPQHGSEMAIYAYFVPSSTDYNPLNTFQGNVYFDVEDHQKVKLDNIEQYYGGELREHPHSRSRENLENLMRVWGAEVGLEYAEKFQLLRQVVK